MAIVDLEYDPNTFVGELDLARVAAFQKWLNGGVSGRMVFDSSYLEHLASAHGGKPGKCCFLTQNGRERRIDRFLNFVNHRLDDLNGANSVSVCWTAVEDRLGSTLMPFAILFAGDHLCFDFSSSGRPKIVVWLHEQSRVGAPVTEFVAEDFDQFLVMLFKLNVVGG